VSFPSPASGRRLVTRPTAAAVAAAAARLWRTATAVRAWRRRQCANRDVRLWTRQKAGGVRVGGVSGIG